MTGTLQSDCIMSQRDVQCCMGEGVYHGVVSQKTLGGWGCIVIFHVFLDGIRATHNGGRKEKTFRGIH